MSIDSKSSRKNQNLDDICKIHHQAVQKVKKQSYITLHTTIYNFLTILNVDYIFNSQRSMTYIEQNNGDKLTNLNGNKITKNDINNLYTKKKKAYVFMDYLHNHGRKDKRIIYDYRGNPIYLDYTSNPRVINPMFLFDEGMKRNKFNRGHIDRYVWMNPSNEKLIVINK